MRSSRRWLGFLAVRSPGESASVVAAFRQGLKEAGSIEGQNPGDRVSLGGEGQYDRLPALATELVGRQVTVIAAVGDVVSALAAKGAAPTIPIVFVIGGDPIRFGLVTSINRPGGNITGVSLISPAIGSKRLELLHKLVPNAAVIGLLMYPDSPHAEPERKDVEEAGRAIGQQIVVVNASSERDFDAAFATLVQQRAGGLLVAGDPFLLIRRRSTRCAGGPLCASYDVPISPVRNGGRAYELWNQHSRRVSSSWRIHWADSKGAKPADLPIFQQTDLELVINLKTAKALGLAIPPPCSFSPTR